MATTAPSANATAAPATCTATAQLASSLHATTPPSAMAASNDTSAMPARRSSAGYASRASTRFATSKGNATRAIPQCVVFSSSTALTTTRPTATALAAAESRKRTPGVTRASLRRLALATLLTQLPPQVVERSCARHVRHLVEVVRWRRRGRVPLEGVPLPRVVADALAAAACLEHVDREEQERDAHDVRADRRDEVVALPALVAVRVDPPRHPLEPGEVLRHEGDVEADEENPELPFAEALVELATEHLGPPVEDAGEDREHDAAEQRVVEVRHDEVAVVHLPVDRERGEVDPGEPADDEEREEAEREEHRGLEGEIPPPERRQPVEDLHPRR